MIIRVMTCVLAALATCTAISMSVIGGWQRGGLLPERLVWVAIGVVLIGGAHLLPALLQGRSRLLRVAGSVLWASCLATACYGHATFFLFSMSHAGKSRAHALRSPSNVPDLVAPSAKEGAIAIARAEAVGQMARLNAQRCSGRCVSLEVRRSELSAKVAALDAQANDARRMQVWNEWQMQSAQRALSREDSARDDL